MIPQLAATIGPRWSRFPCYLQPKLNGVRCLAQVQPNGVCVFMSRDEKLWARTKLAHLAEQLESIKDIVENRILDGELYVHGWKLQRINGAVSVKSQTPREDTHEVEYHVFDVVDPGKQFSVRWPEFIDTIRGVDLPNIKTVETTFINDRERMEVEFKYFTRLGYEGVMLRPDGPYVFGQTLLGTRKNSEFLWKYKAWEDGEFKCIGVTQGEGKADIGIGALICGCSTPITSGPISVACPTSFRVGTGFDDNERRAFMLNPPIGKLVKVRYLCLTDAGIPFNPSFLAVLD